MSFSRPHRLAPENNCALRRNYRPSFDRTTTTNGSFSRKHHHHRLYSHEDYNHEFSAPAPPLKRRRLPSGPAWGENYQMEHRQRRPMIGAGNDPSTSGCGFFDPAGSDGDEEVFMSRDEIERCSPSRKDGIDPMRETHLRYSYCAFLQTLGLRLELPQTTIGTAMVLCHRFFVRRSHANHDRFLIATAALFLTAKSEETPRPLNTVLKASCDLCHKQDFNFFSNLLPVDWFEQYKERVIDAEQTILTTLNFELNVQHPYDPLTSVLNKLGLSQTVLVNMALSLISEG
ncbi:Cyclin-T1-4 [Acorus calamus]|uniref:Cyclin-T1-4 n=1 Tax=Acorus calamus TaxID=4465 RepID=A0AAV9EPG7_ACOCL|nr:Cyclin-T1-4 [Acorus calamus]